MHLASEYGANKIWIVNVGDLKPMEFPISFFLDYAWNPRAWPAERLPEYARQWAEQLPESSMRADAFREIAVQEQIKYLSPPSPR